MGDQVTKRLSVVAIVVAIVVGCHGDVAPPPVEQSVMRPGTDVSLAAIAREALSCPNDTLSCSVIEPNGGSVTQAGIYSAPACGPSFVAGTYHVQAAGCGRVALLPVTVAEDVISVAIVCAVVQGTACCATGPLTVPPGGGIQFYAGVTYSCPGHVVYSPATPPAACP